MTCLQALSLLDDYIDSELNPTQAADMEKHLAICQSCRQEYETGLQLKQVLRQSLDESSLPSPKDEYWSEVTSLVLARTVDSDESGKTPDRVVPILPGRESRQPLFRSLMLFAASLALLLGALYVGSQRQQLARHFSDSHATLYVAASLGDVLASDNNAVVTKEEEITLMRGMLALGVPGSIGRYGGLVELIGAP